MAHILNFKHNLIEIDGVPDNLRIFVGEKFTLEVADPTDGEHYEWFANRDPVLEEVPGLDHSGANAKREYIAASVGSSVIQLQVSVGGAETVIDRRYKVDVVTAEAVTARLTSRGTEPLDSEKA